MLEDNKSTKKKKREQSRDVSIEKKRGPLHKIKS